MPCHRNYDTVAFDVRDDATMLFFARTTPSGDIDDYLLLMRAEASELGPTVYIEMNERQFAGHNLIAEARMAGNVLTLELHEAAPELEGARQLVLSYKDTPENKASVEAGAFRVLGDRLAGGNA